MAVATIDQAGRQLEAVGALSPPAQQYAGSDGSRTAPQVHAMVSTTDGELPRPRSVGDQFYRKARDIRRDPTIRLARELAMAPLLMAEWEYEETDSAAGYPGAKALVEAVMAPMRLPLLRTSLCGMTDFGWQPYEIVADQCTDGTTRPRLKPLLQDFTAILVDAADGSFFGLRQAPMVGLNLGWTYLLAGECLVVSQDVEGTNWYGEPTLRCLEPVYDESQVVAKTSRKYDAKIAGTHWVIYYPLGTSTYGGEELDNGEIARRLLLAAEAVGGICVPRSVVNTLDTMNAALAQSEASQWKIELLTDSGKGQQPFTDRQKYLDTLKVRAFGFPERAVLEGQFGTKAEAGEHADMAVANLEVRHAMACAQYNQGLVDWTLEKNYGAEARGCVRIRPSPLADSTRAFMEQLYLALVANPQGFAVEQSALDLQQLRDRLGLPEHKLQPVLPGQDPLLAGTVDPLTGALLPQPLSGQDPAGPLGYGDGAAGPQLPGALPYQMAFDPAEPRAEDGRWTVEAGAVRGVRHVYRGRKRVGTVYDAGRRHVSENHETGERKVHKTYREAVGHLLPADTAVALAFGDGAYDADADPTDAQRSAGNYRVGRLRVHGLDVSVETPRGERRKKGWPKLPAHYGYIRRTEGEDGDHLDCFVGRHGDADEVYVIRQNDEHGKFDEHKVMLGFKSKKKAVRAYSRAYGGRDPASVETVPASEFRAWMEGEGVALAFDPDEPRKAKGEDGGGQWTKEGGEASKSPRITRQVLGDCYDSAWNKVVYDEEAEKLGKLMRKPVMLCHGYPTHPPTGKKMGHAWTEVGDLVLDHDVTLPRSIYYRAGDIDPKTVSRYTRDEALKLALKKGTYGPFEHKVEGALFRDTEGLADLKPALRKDLAKISQRYPPYDSEGKTTKQRFVSPDGEVMPERKRLHDRIVRAQVEGHDSQGEPAFVLMGGGPAAGKSTILKSGSFTLPHDHVMVANDDYKPMFPEYKAMLKHGDDRAAAYVHEESGLVTKRIFAESLAAKNNTVLDGTGDNGLDSLKEKIDKARASGHRVVGQYVTCDVDTALRRSAEREKKTGRKMPEPVLRADHAGVSKTLPLAVKAGLFDEVTLWDTDRGGSPVRVMSARGYNMTVHDSALWDKFLAKGKG